MDPLLDSAPCGFVSFSDDGRILAINATLASWLGRDADGLRGQPFDLLLTPGARVFHQTHFFPLLKLQGRAEEIYLLLRDAAGADVPVLLNAARRHDARGVSNDCAVLRIAGRERFEEELLQARRLAETVSEAKSRFLSMISHELRTPLQSIALFTELLASQGHGPITDRQSADVRGIQAATRHLVTLIDDILEFSRLESGNVELRLETVPARAALSRAEALMRPRFEQAGLEYSSDEPDASIRADPDRLQQILLNLLTNAAKFTPRGGRVRVEVWPEGDAVRIQVRDTGAGIPSSDLDRIFEPFVQVDRGRVKASERGFGLGLSISRELARAMGGELTVESALGQGSRFTLSLPEAGSAG